MQINIFNNNQYFDILDKIIYDILSRDQKEVFTYDILDTEKSNNNKRIVLLEKQRQMKIGEIWQEAIGNYKSFHNLKNGDKSGLDIISYDRKIIMELKNRTNSDNTSSRKTNFDKLAKYKKENPDFKCIYACINDNTKKKTLEGCIKIITHKNVEIEQYVGIKLLELVFQENTKIIIEFIKNTIDKYT